MDELQAIVDSFDVNASVAYIAPLGNGLINDTYLVKTVGDSDDYVLQRINTNVFTDPSIVMNNIRLVTDHLRRCLAQRGVKDLKHRVLQFISLKDDAKKLYFENGTGCWRLMVYVDHTLTKQEVNVDNARAAGKAFGEFQALLSTLPLKDAEGNELLGETITDFHNMEFRIEQLKEACIKDEAGHFDEYPVQELLQELGSRAEEMTQAERLYREGKLPKRVCHCDTKVNNMLFSEDGSEVLCIIDLDTVMPSFIFSDYGDFLRTAANTVAEDEPDYSKIEFRRDIYDAFTEGYLSSAREFLTPLEIEMLPFAVKLFPYMQSVRFLWDYLNGDKYWKVNYPEHNLVRAKNQFEFLKKIEKEID